MFHFTGCPLLRLWIHLRVTGHYPSRVPPFGNLRIKAYLQLPEAYRSLSRPSSAISAMASTLRSYSLDLAKLLSDLPKTIERPNRRNFFPLLLFLYSFLCSFQGAIEVSTDFVCLSAHFSVLRNLKTIQKLFLKHNLISSPTFAGYLPVFLRLCFLIEAFYLPITFVIVPTLEVEQFIQPLVSP